jgi:putative phosphoesterase
MTGKIIEIAIVSDIHGNSWAFREVLADIKSKGISTIINLGDSLYGPLDPKGTYDLLIDHKVISISGNEDRIILDHPGSKPENDTLEYVKARIDKDIVNWLKSLAFDLIYLDDIYCCHATPECDSAYLLENVHSGHITMKGRTEIDDMLKDIRQKIVVCGHSHISRIIDTDHKTIINPGSVGCQAYDDDRPIPHKMENFSSHAKYSILTFAGKLTKVNIVSIPYDFEQAAGVAEKNNRKDWAKWIRTGRA